MQSFGALPSPLRFNFLALMISGLCFWASLGSLLPTLPLYIQDQGGTEQQVGLVMGAFAIGLIGARAPLGMLADQRSRKLVLLIGTAVAATAPLCYIFAQNVWLLYGIRAFHGISIAAFTTAYSALVVDLSPSHQRGEILGLASLVQPVGVMLGPSMGGYLQAHAGYLALFLLAASLGLGGLLCISYVQDASHIDSSSSQQEAPANRPNTEFWGLIFAPRLRIPAVVMLLMGLTFGTLATFVPLLIKATQVDLNAGLFYTAAAVASFSIRLLTGPASDRLGRGRFISLGLLSYGLAMVTLWLAQQRLLFIVAAVFQGWGSGMLLPMMATLMADRSAATERARVISLCILGFDVGIAIAGPALGTVALELGIRNMFGVACGFALCALGIFITLNSKDLHHSLAFALGRGRDVYALPKS